MAVIFFGLKCNNDRGKTPVFIIISLLLHVVLFAGLGYCRINQNQKKSPSVASQYPVSIISSPVKEINKPALLVPEKVKPPVKTKISSINKSKAPAEKKRIIKPAADKKREIASAIFSEENYPKASVKRTKRPERKKAEPADVPVVFNKPVDRKPAVLKVANNRQLAHQKEQSYSNPADLPVVPELSSYGADNPINAEDNTATKKTDTAGIPSGSPAETAPAPGFETGTETPSGNSKPVFDRSYLVRFRETVAGKVESGKKYPGEARNDRLEGTVEVAFIITPDGTPSSVTVKSSSGHKILDDAAVESVNSSGPYLPFPQGLERPVSVKLKVHYKIYN